ncbi:MAG: hypothetical protein JKY54_07905, partial [Flavobacteriales bacterium]|nr:hypothetical protein [Flavobacteriales bacterium]
MKGAPMLNTCTFKPRILFSFSTGKTPKNGFMESVYLSLVISYLAVFSSPTLAKDTSEMNYQYILGHKEYIDKLYPPADLAKFYLPEQTTAAVIEHYLALSLSRDGIRVKNSLKVKVIKDDDDKEVYQVSFSTIDTRAAHYKKVQPEWLSERLSGQALNGAGVC